MRVGNSDANSFEATNDKISLDIYPRKEENLTYDGMKNAIMKWADDNQVVYSNYNTNGDKQPIYLDDINGIGVVQLIVKRIVILRLFYC